MSAVSECKGVRVSQRRTPAELQKQALDFLKEKVAESSQLFFPFLKEFTEQTRRDQLPALHTFTILDKKYTQSRETAVAAFNQFYPSLNRSFQARFFQAPQNATKPTELDTAKVLRYQQDRLDQKTFLPLNYIGINQAFVNVALTLSIEDTSIIAAEYFCPWPIENNTVYVRRMDKAHIDSSLKHIASIFNKILKPLKPYTPEDLKRDLAELSYKWTFTSPFEEESDEFIALVQKTLAAFHGYQWEGKKNANIYAKALGIPNYPDFLEDYNQTVSLVKEAAR